MDIEKVNSYINDIYSKTTTLSKEKYGHETSLKNFVPTVDTEVARFLALIIDMTKPRQILEIGTSIGYSTCSMANAVKKWRGEITTIEFDATVAKQAMENFKREGVDDCIKLLQGDARKILPSLSASYDMIFQDVDKSLYPELYEDCIRLLKPEGILIADDTLFPVMDLGEKWNYLVPYIERFNEMVANDRRLSSTIVPLGDGVTVIVKKSI